MNGRTCYIAGPMRGVPAFNFPAFDEARDTLTREGWRVISPADMDREAQFPADKVPVNTVFSPEQNRVFYKRDSDALLSLRAERGDAIFFLPGWENSTGAIAEFAIGRWVKLSLIEYTSRVNISSVRLTANANWHLQAASQGERI